MSIDVHAHLVPAALADRLCARDTRPTISGAGLKARDQDRILGDNARELFESID